MSGGRLRLADDVYYAATPDGMNVLTGRGLISVVGASIHQWMDRLAPHLDGTRTLTDLTEGLSAERQRFVEQFLRDLMDQGVVHEVADDTAAGLTEDELAEYQAELGFVRQFRTPAASAFARHRTGVVAVIGTGPLLAPTIRALLATGIRTVHAVNPNGIDSVCTRDPAQRVEHRSPKAFTTTLVTGANVIVHVADSPITDWAEPLERFCAESATPLVQAIRMGDAVWLIGMGCEGWSHAQRRLAALGAVTTDGPSISATDATVVAGQLAQDIFRYVTGVDRSGVRMARIELTTLRTTWHRLLPHPLGATATPADAASAAATFARLDAAPALDPDRFDRSAVALMDSRTGVFADITEGDARQLPLYVARTTVSDPVGLLGPGRARPTACGFGADLDTARRRAVFRALETYGSLMVDQRRVADGHVWGIDLSTRRPLRVPVRRAFPALRRDGSSPTPFVPPVGVAAGYSWAKALRDGLLRHCRELAVTTAIASGAAPEPVDLAGAASADMTIARYRSLLAATGEAFVAYDMTRPLGVPAYAATLSGRAVATGCGISAVDAMRDVLERTLVRYQMRAEGTADATGPAAVLANGRRHANRRFAPACPAHRLTVSDLVDRIVRTGRRVVAVPLDHDQEVHRIMPNIVHVVVTRADG